MTNKENKREECGFAFWGTCVGLILSALSFACAVLEQYGITLPGVMPSIMSQSIVWLPFLWGIAGGFLGWCVRDRKTKNEIKQLGMPIEEAVERLKEIEQGISQAELQFRSLSFEAKGICYVPARDGKREISGAEDLKTNLEASEWKEAIDAGFLMVEECGTHQHRICATKKLSDLVKSKPEMLDELHEDLVNDFPKNFRLEQSMNEKEGIWSTKIVDKFTGEVSDKWKIGINHKN